MLNYTYRQLLILKTASVPCFSIVYILSTYTSLSYDVRPNRLSDASFTAYAAYLCSGHCGGSGSVCFGASRSGSISTSYGSGSGSFCHQVKIIRKTYCFVTSLWLLSLKNAVNVASQIRNLPKKCHGSQHWFLCLLSILKCYPTPVPIGFITNRSRYCTSLFFNLHILTLTGNSAQRPKAGECPPWSGPPPGGHHRLRAEQLLEPGQDTQYILRLCRVRRPGTLRQTELWARGTSILKWAI